VLTNEDMRRRIARSRVATLATVRPDGTPHAVPFCFVLAGGEIFSAVDQKPKASMRLARLENVRANPRVTVLVDEWSEDWSRLWWVRIDGPARVLESGPEAEMALALLAEKYEQYRRQPPAGPVLAISAERWTGWSGS
jgi:PPOX class probable F420-dependent enzyme